MTKESIDKFFLKFFDAVAQLCEILKLIPGRTKMVDKFLSSPQFKSIFDQADIKGKGTLGTDEVYTLVLRFYIFMAQYTFVMARQVPTREDVLRMLSHSDINAGGGVRFEEFKIIVLMLCEGVAVHLAAQTFFTMVISPLMALALIFLLKHMFFLFPYLSSQFWFIPSFLCNDKVGLLCFVAGFNFLVVPYYLDYVFYIQALRSPETVHFVPDMTQFHLVKLSKKEATSDSAVSSDSMEKVDMGEKDNEEGENDEEEDEKQKGLKVAKGVSEETGSTENNEISNSSVTVSESQAGVDEDCNQNRVDDEPQGTTGIVEDCDTKEEANHEEEEEDVVFVEKDAMSKKED